MGKTISYNFGRDGRDYPIRRTDPGEPGHSPPAQRPRQPIFNLTAIRFLSDIFGVLTIILIGFPRRSLCLYVGIIEYERNCLNVGLTL